MHGWENSHAEMRPVFIGHGANFKQNYVHNKTVHSVDMFPLISHLIGLNTSTISTNGSLDRVVDMLTDGGTVYWIKTMIVSAGNPYELAFANL